MVYTKLASDASTETSFIFDSGNGTVSRLQSQYWTEVQSSNKRIRPRWRLGYIDKDDSAFSFLALGRCTECEGTTRLILERLGQRYACEACNGNSQAEGDWAQFLAKLKSATDSGLPRAPGPVLSLTNASQHQEVANMNGWLRSIAEGVVVALGPFGAPVKTVLDRMAQRDFERLEEKIDTLISDGRIEKTEIISVLQTDAISAPISWALAGWVERYHEEHGGDLSGLREVTPVSGSMVSERELSQELGRLYPEVELLAADFNGAGIRLGRIRRTGISDVDIGNMVMGLRGQTVGSIQKLAEILFAQNPGSGILNRFRQSLEEFNNKLAG